MEARLASSSTSAPKKDLGKDKTASSAQQNATQPTTSAGPSHTKSSAGIGGSSSHAGPSSQGGPSSSASRASQGVAGKDADADASSEMDDYLCALMLQISLIAEDRGTGQLGKTSSESDAQFAINHILEEVQEMEKSYREAKRIDMCGLVPDDLFEDMLQQDSIASSDRELAERLGKGEPSAELLVQAANLRFQVVVQVFCKTAECCSCGSTKQTYTATCGHAYCEECMKSLYSHALKNKAFAPVRCCTVAFAPDIVTACLDNADSVERYNAIKDEIENPCPPAAELDMAASKLISEHGWKVCTRCGAVRYNAIKSEIEHPCPPPAELDMAASKLISENGWKVCSRCGAVVERASGCVHMTCHCKNEFCYICLRKWRTCTCELYPVAELNRILNERVGNDDAGVARHRLQNVLHNYYQHAHNWKRENANGRVCNVCRWDLPLYCMYCDVCMEARCQRCCYNH
ncbi:hypothetical protein EDD21DRAFT_332442 [Dissophora ornata]|nr:hypothetical protein EDD21DRAFT_332442 [Dissophora ornata]